MTGWRPTRTTRGALPARQRLPPGQHRQGRPRLPPGRRAGPGRRRGPLVAGRRPAGGRPVRRGPAPPGAASRPRLARPRPPPAAGPVARPPRPVGGSAGRCSTPTWPTTPTTPWPCASAGRLEFYAGNLPAAEQALREAVRVQPSDYQSRYTLVQCLRQQQKDDAAREEEDAAEKVKERQATPRRAAQPRDVNAAARPGAALPHGRAPRRSRLLRRGREMAVQRPKRGPRLPPRSCRPGRLLRAPPARAGTGGRTAPPGPRGQGGPTPTRARKRSRRTTGQDPHQPKARARERSSPRSRFGLVGGGSTPAGFRIFALIS